jgi:hypothetical protein
MGKKKNLDDWKKGFWGKKLEKIEKIENSEKMNVPFIIGLY